jgi:hypothetical protein
VYHSTHRGQFVWHEILVQEFQEEWNKDMAYRFYTQAKVSEATLTRWKKDSYALKETLLPCWI